MKPIAHFLAALLMPVLGAVAQDAPAQKCSGQITEIAKDARQITAGVKVAGASTSMTFAVSPNCKFTTKGFGVFDDLKKGDLVKIEYVAKSGASPEAVNIVVTGSGAVPAPLTTPAPSSSTPAPATGGASSHGDDQTTLACRGQLTAVATNARQITAEIKVVGGTTSKVFVVSENCKITTKGMGVYNELRRGDNVEIEYLEKSAGVNEATRIAVQFASTAPAKPPAKKAAPAKKPAPKKTPAKKK